MKNFIAKYFGIKPGEGIRAFLMFGSLFNIISSLMLFKPVSTSLFISNVGYDQLPLAYINVALFSAIIVPLYNKISKRLPLIRLVRFTFYIAASILVVFWFFLHSGYSASWFIFTFYVVVALFGVFLTTQFWLLANYIFNAREARSLFGFIGAGGIAGGIFGGYFARIITPLPFVGTVNLLLICVVFVLIAAFLLDTAWRRRVAADFEGISRKQSRKSSTLSKASPLKQVLSSKHLSYIALIIGISVIVAKLVDYQFSVVAAEASDSADELTAFIGFWLSNLSVISLFIQFLLTGRILRRFGVIVSLFFLPMGIFTGALAILLQPSLIAAVFIKVNEGAFKQSINKSAIELLSLPVPPELKKNTKTFIDVLVDSFATGLGGLFILLLTKFLNLPVQEISLLTIILLFAWIFLIVVVRKEYVNAFRNAIEKRIIEPEEINLNLQDATVFETITKTLSGDNGRQIYYLLRLLKNNTDERLAEYYQKLINHPSDEIKREALKRALPLESIDLTDDIKPLIETSNMRITSDYITYVCLHSDNPDMIFAEMIGSKNLKVIASSLFAAAEETYKNKKIPEGINFKNIIDDIYVLMESDDTISIKEKNEAKKLIARSIGLINDIPLYKRLHELLKDDSYKVVVEAVKSAGMTKAEEFLPLLISRLALDKIRSKARVALARYGNKIIPRLESVLTDDNENISVRHEIPKIMNLIGSQEAFNTLQRNVDQPVASLKYEIILALYKLKRYSTDIITIDSKKIRINIINETEFYFKTSDYINVLKNRRSANNERANKSKRLLLTALKEKQKNIKELIFLLLGILYPDEDTDNLLYKLESNNSNQVANALELLDNLIRLPYKKRILLIFDSDLENSLDLEHITGIRIKEYRDVINSLLECNDRWLRACTMHYLGENDESRFTNEIVQSQNDLDDNLLTEIGDSAVKKLATL